MRDRFSRELRAGKCRFILNGMQCVTTNSIDGKQVVSYRGLVASEVIFGADFIRDFAASITDAVGGRSTTYEREFEKARKAALATIIEKAKALAADAIIGLRLDYQILGEKNGMMMVAAYGTAVRLAKSDEERQKDEEQVAEEEAVYFVEISGATKGPFSLVQLRDLESSGHIEKTSPVRIEGKTGEKSLYEVLRG